MLSVYVKGEGGVTATISLVRGRTPRRQYGSRNTGDGGSLGVGRRRCQGIVGRQRIRPMAYRVLATRLCWRAARQRE